MTEAPSAAILLLAALLAAAPTRATPPVTPPVTPPAGAPLESLQRLRVSDPPAFIAAVRRLESAPPPPLPRDRDLLRLLGAQALALEARYEAALQAAAPLAEAAATRELRLRASALIVNVQAATRDLVAGQQRLEPLLAEVGATDDPALHRHVRLVAAVFYNQLAQHDLALRHAEWVLARSPDPVDACAAMLQALEAQLQRQPQRLDDASFENATTRCDEAGSPQLRGFVDVAHARWATGQGEAAAAVPRLSARLPAITATGYPLLRAKAHAQLAESLQKAGRFDAAEREAEAALALSASLPTGLPLLMARRTRYEIALARGDTARALSELQAVVTAERAYMDEVRRLQEAYHAGRAETMARQQSLALLDERNTQLALEAESDARTALLLYLLLLPIALGLAALAGWAWRSRRLQRRHRHLLQVDPLTGLWTRPHFTAKAALALAAAERAGQPMALVLFDLDHFSEVNTRHGHLSGDSLLAAIGAALAPLEAPDQRFGRLGGEEFALLLPRAGLDEGLAFAERCREAVAGARATALDGQTVMAVTASFGVVSTTAAGYRLRDLLSNADHALYRAKSAGRNRIAAAVVVPTTDAPAAA